MANDDSGLKQDKPELSGRGQDINNLEAWEGDAGNIMIKLLLLIRNSYLNILFAQWRMAVREQVFGTGEARGE